MGKIHTKVDKDKSDESAIILLSETHTNNKDVIAFIHEKRQQINKECVKVLWPSGFPRLVSPWNAMKDSG